MEINSVEEFKEYAQELFGEQIIFNKEFEAQFDILKEKQIKDFISWCEDIASGDEEPAFADNLCFLRKFGSINRSIVVKVRNGEYIEFHLGNHKYYEKQLKRLGISDNPRRYS